LLTNFGFGLAILAGLALVIFLWVGIPMVWMSYPGADGKEFTTIGTVWVLGPLVLIVIAVITWLGGALRR
jgi:heme/copper-type cytochrome/quinol oxidase subunit 2